MTAQRLRALLIIHTWTYLSAAQNLEGLLWSEPCNGKQYMDLCVGNKNKENSRELCEKKGGFLPKPMNEEENNFLKKFASQNFFLGINDTATEGDWVYDGDGTPLQWTGWDPSQANIDGKVVDCAILSEFGQNQYWYATRCDDNSVMGTVICEKRRTFKPRHKIRKQETTHPTTSEQTIFTSSLAKSTGSTFISRPKNITTEKPGTRANFDNEPSTSSLGLSSTSRTRNITTECSDCGTEEKKSFFDSDAVKITGVVLGVAAAVFTSVGIISMITGAIPLPFPNPFAPANAPGQVDHGNRGNIENTDNEARNVQKALAKRENSSSSSIGSSSSSYSSFSSSSNTSGSVESKSPEPSDLKNEPT